MSPLNWLCEPSNPPKFRSLLSLRRKLNVLKAYLSFENKKLIGQSYNPKPKNVHHRNRCIHSFALFQEFIKPISTSLFRFAFSE